MGLICPLFEQVYKKKQGIENREWGTGQIQGKEAQNEPGTERGKDKKAKKIRRAVFLYFLFRLRPF
jgi:hypothetical protein